MRTGYNPIYRLLNRDYHESFDFYVPRLADFHELVSSKLQPGWEITRRGIWFQCASAQNIPPDQGWKIQYLDSAHQVAHGVMRFSVIRQGIACPGDSLSRLSCHYGTGSGGIALFPNRLIGRQGSDFLRDELLKVTETPSLPCPRGQPLREIA